MQFSSQPRPLSIFLIAVLTPLPLAPQANSLTPELWRSDLAYLARELPHKHVNAFARLSRPDFDSQVADLNSRIPSLSEPEIRTGILKLVASIGDAHTNIQSWGRPDAFRRLPLTLYWFQDGIFVVAAAEQYRTLLGGKLERLGRMSVDEACRTMSALVPHENDAWLKAQLPATLVTSELLHAMGVTDAPDNARVEVQPLSGERISVMVQAMSPSQPVPMLRAFNGQPPLYVRNARIPYTAAIIDGGTTVYFQYNRCFDDPKLPFADFRSQLKAMLAKDGVQRLVLDLRNNLGGNSRVLDPWINEIKSGPFNRKGRLFVIVGRLTISSSLMHAVRLRDQTAATLIGEPTGGKPNHFGDLRSLELPSSHIQVSYSTKYFKYTKDEGVTLTPDVIVAERSQDFLTGADPVLTSIFPARASDIEIKLAHDSAKERQTKVQLEQVLSSYPIGFARGARADN
jgi:hypothetical protein